MTSFGWKRKLGGRVSREASSSFESKTGVLQEDSPADDGPHEDNFWDVFSKRRKVMILEDSASKSQRLKAEGETLADAGRFWEAVKKWNEALQYTPANEFLYEMKAQVLMELHEVYPAVEAAQQATVLAPQWWVAYQTLGRAQLGLGEITMAVKSFSRAAHMNPAEYSLWEEDLRWACSLRDQLKKRTRGVKHQDQNKSHILKPSATGDTEVCDETVPLSRLCVEDCDAGQSTGEAETKEAEARVLVSSPDDSSNDDELFCREGFR